VIYIKAILVFAEQAKPITNETTGKVTNGTFLTFLTESKKVKKLFANDEDPKGYKKDMVTDLFSSDGVITVLDLETEIADYRGRLSEKLAKVTVAE